MPEPQTITETPTERALSHSGLLGGLSGLMVSLQRRLKDYNPEEDPGLWDQTVREIQTIRDAKYVVNCYDRQAPPNDEVSGSRPKD